MSALSIQPPFPIFTDTDGSPLENGYIWLGATNLNPQTSPITAYWDAALTITAAQPIRTIGGYPSNAGTPGRLYVNVSSSYSILVQNKNGSTVYSAPAATEREIAANVSYTPTSPLTATNVQAALDELVTNPSLPYAPGPNSLLTATNVPDALDQLSDDETGSSVVGFIQAGANAAPRTAQDKLRERVSVKDFGAKGDCNPITGVGTDDSDSIQYAVDYANSIGADVYFPAGVYKISRAIVINNSGDVLDTYKASIYGDGSSSARIFGVNGNFNMLEILGGTGAGAHSHQVVRGLFLVKNDLQGACIAIDNAAFLSIEDVSTLNGNYGVYLTDVLSSTFSSCNFRFANYGIRAEYATFSRPNALTLTGCVIGNNYNYGAWVIGGTTFNMFGGSVENNGVGGTGTTYGVLLANSGVEGSVSGSFNGVYFEQNVGVADIWLASSTTSTAASISGCSFNRIDSTNFTTNNIYVETSGVGVVQTVNISGCGFKGFNTYTPSASRPYIDGSATSGGVNTVAWSGCLFQSALEIPTIPNEIVLSGTGGGTVVAVTATAPLASSGGAAPNLTISLASGVSNGYLSSTDWNTFNGKVSSVTASSPLSSTGGATPNLSIPLANSGTSGYLSSTDWNTFNGKASTAFPGWTGVTYQNSWSWGGIPNPTTAFYKDAFGRVYLRGVAIHPSTSSATIFTLPVGYRPTAQETFSVYGESPAGTPVLSIVIITSSGDVSMLPAGSVVSFANISFQTN